VLIKVSIELIKVDFINKVMLVLDDFFE